MARSQGPAGKVQGRLGSYLRFLGTCTWLGTRTGLAVGLAASVVGAVAIIFTSSASSTYSVGLIFLAFEAGLVNGILVGFLLGLLNGLILGALIQTHVLSRSGSIRSGLASSISALIGGAAGLLLLQHLFNGEPLFIYPPAIVAAALSAWLCRARIRIS